MSAIRISFSSKVCDSNPKASVKSSRTILASSCEVLLCANSRAICRV